MDQTLIDICIDGYNFPAEPSPFVRSSNRDRAFRAGQILMQGEMARPIAFAPSRGHSYRITLSIHTQLIITFTDEDNPVWR